MGEGRMKVIDWFCHSSEIREQIENSRERLYRVAYSWCHDMDLADDLVQDTVIKAFRNNKQLRDVKAINSWLFRILYNCWCDHLRSKKDTVSYDDNLQYHDQSPENITATLETVTQVQNSIKALPEGQRQVVTLVAMEGFSYGEVAEILDIPIGTVMSRLCRARNTLAERLKKSSQMIRKINPALRRVK